MSKWTRRAFITSGIVAGGGVVVGIAMRPGNQVKDLAAKLGDDGANLIVDHGQAIIVGQEPEEDQKIVDHPLLLQDRDPGRCANQQRRPERQQDQDQQQVAGACRQCRQQIRNWVGKEQAEHGD